MHESHQNSRKFINLRIDSLSTCTVHTICSCRIAKSRNVECDFYTFKGSQVKRFLSVIVILHCCLLSGCFSCLSSWCLGEETYERLMHPKGLGEYWEKPGMNVDVWRADWVSCGGNPNGSYSTDTPPRSSQELIRENFSKKSKEIWICMTSQNYYFTGKYWPQ